MDKRITILIGPPASGKSYLAGLIARSADTVYLDGKKIKRKTAIGNSCSDDTKVIIIDDLPPREVPEVAERFFHDKLVIYGQYWQKTSKSIPMPRIVICCDNQDHPDLAQQLLQQPASFVRRVMIISVQLSKN